MSTRSVDTPDSIGTAIARSAMTSPVAVKSAPACGRGPDQNTQAESVPAVVQIPPSGHCGAGPSGSQTSWQ